MLHNLCADKRSHYLICLNHLGKSLYPHTPDCQALQPQACFCGLVLVRFKQGSRMGALGKWENGWGLFTSTVTITSHRSYDDHCSCPFCSPRQLFGLLLCASSTRRPQTFLLTTSQTYSWHWKPSWSHSRSQGCLSHLFTHPAIAGTLPLFSPCQDNHPEKASFSFPAFLPPSDLCLHPRAPPWTPLPT